MESTRLEKLAFLSADQMNAIYDNFRYLKEKLSAEGFLVGALKNNSVTYDIHPKEILEKFANVENNIEEIRSALGALSPTYEKFEWQPHSTGRRERVWYWIDFINDACKLAQTYTMLFDINNEPIYDINGEQIIVLQEGKK